MSGTQHKVDGKKKPRVHITYDVETNGSAVKRELPFVMGIVGDFSGNPTQPPEALKNRKFVDIHSGNFDAVMKSIKPELNIRVKDVLQGGDKEMAVKLDFACMDDLGADQIVEKLPVLKAMKETRDKLRDLLTTMDQSDPNLEGQLEEILKNTAQLQQRASELGIIGDGNSEGGAK